MRAGERAALLFATCLGLGYLRPASGTIGSAFGVLLYWACLEPVGVTLQLAAVVVTAFLGVIAASSACRTLGSGDPSQVVIDEVAGMWLSLVGVHGSTGLAIAFVAFRAFDVVKPWPAGALETLPGGWGVVADDLAAGVYALASTHAILWAWG